MEDSFQVPETIKLPKGSYKSSNNSERLLERENQHVHVHH